MGATLDGVTSALYAYSLLPVLSVSLLLFFTAVLRGRNAVGLASYCLSLATWSGALFLISFPKAAWLGERLAAIGAFTAAGYLHAAYDLTRQRRYELVWLAYVVALAITVLGALRPGVLYGPLAMERGPLFWPAMALAVTAATLPMFKLASSWKGARGEEKALLRNLLLAGAMGYAGGLSNALLLSGGLPLPYGMYLVLGGLLVLAHVVRAHEPAAERRLLDRSLLYSALAAFLSAGFLFGVMSLMSAATERFLTEYRLGAYVLLGLSALAFEPLRRELQGWIGKRLLKDRADSAELAHALAAQEARAEQASRLAELGTFASAVAHEVRNPLGVLSAHLKLLERGGADPSTCAAMREQIERAGHFVEDLLRYGRPRPLELRWVELAVTVELASSTAKTGLPPAASEGTSVELAIAPGALVEADQGQLGQLLVILLENALLAVAEANVKRIRVRGAVKDERAWLCIEDSGPGIPPELAARLFQPFVTGRARGTGLGLAIAKGIAERHGGTLRAGPSELGGAAFELVLPRVQPVLAAAVARA